jgi:hypothetical protein
MSNCDFYYLYKSKKCNEHYHNFTGLKKLNPCNANTDSHMKQPGIINKSNDFILRKRINIIVIGFR